jgi:cytochrome c peroxidase
VKRCASTRFDISRLIATALAVLGLSLAATTASADLRIEVLRKMAIAQGVLHHPYAVPELDPALVDLGRRLFEEPLLSLNSDISCSVCHLPDFGSTDGLPNAIGVLGVGRGPERAESDGVIVPRNVLPLWGRGGPGFDAFFWDGKVELDGPDIRSQFGNSVPSDDPLVVAVHLPFVELREMVIDDEVVETRFENESVAAAAQVYDILAARIVRVPEYARDISAVFGVSREGIRFLHIAEAIAAFIRHRFALTDTRFTKFLRGEGNLSDAEVAGGLLFFGKGRCASCHRGPYFSDFRFHAVPLPQIGFGKNGFGVDYGRFNVTHKPADLYRFRTPPLINVTKTAPYGHAGAIYDLAAAISAHFDPLGAIDLETMDAFARFELYKRLLASSPDAAAVGFLDGDEVRAIEAFLGTLTLFER